MSTRYLPIGLTATVAFFCVAEAVSANDRDLLATTVPATACEPIDSSHAGRVRISNGAWVFDGSSTGTVFFYCPMPRNARTLSSGKNANRISAYRIYYRDPDGLGTAARVTARLVYRTSDGLISGGNAWDSNGAGDATGNTTALHPNPHNLQLDALYSFLVTLERTGTDVDPAFGGIDFANP